MTDSIHICTAADKNYKLPLCCLINSLLRNCNAHKYTLHILFDGLSKRFQNRLHTMCYDSNICLNFIDMQTYDFDFHGLDMQHWTKTIFYRIMIPDIFKNLDRILYIDCDTLVLQDLFSFFYTPLDSKTNMAMVVDRFSYRSRIPVLNTKNYFNSGMILFDIPKCRNDNFSMKCIQWIHNNPKLAKFPDQDAINVVCDGKILRVSNLYNKQFATTDTIKIDTKPFIIHFLSAIKPWMWKAPVKYSQLYRSYTPNKIQSIIILAKQLVQKTRHLCFHTKYGTFLEKTTVKEYKKYYIFNVCIHTKHFKHRHNDLIQMLQQNKSKQNAN
ncbi:MAG: glycosyltransferase family 8 protein [Alphaproteobacteria bacterium]|nr:glycosyltransferase family 8 protein [Alphaproteobacteria bacterium]